jgi:hypothetical protein
LASIFVFFNTSCSSGILLPYLASQGDVLFMLVGIKGPICGGKEPQLVKSR